MRGLPGPIMQNGFVVRDLEAAVHFWAETFGVGPFFAMRHIPFATCVYRGEPTDADLSVAIAYSGEHQIELVQQHNDAPSIYSEWLDERKLSSLRAEGFRLRNRDWANGLPDAPWPPVYPKMPNEPPRVSPSRAKQG